MRCAFSLTVACTELTTFRVNFDHLHPSRYQEVMKLHDKCFCFGLMCLFWWLQTTQYMHDALLIVLCDITGCLMPSYHVNFHIFTCMEFEAKRTKRGNQHASCKLSWQSCTWYLVPACFVVHSVVFSFRAQHYRHFGPHKWTSLICSSSIWFKKFLRLCLKYVNKIIKYHNQKKLLSD